MTELTVLLDGLTFPEGPRWRTAPAPGWHAVSVSLLHGWRSLVPDGTGRFVLAGDEDFTWLLAHEPVARAGDSILIYRVDEPPGRGEQ